MKKAVSMALTAALLAVPATTMPAAAYSSTQQNTAEALNHLELFLGTGSGFELDRQMTRVEGVTMLVRMLGLEDEADKAPAHPFQDVDDWADDYVSCAWSEGLSNGVSSIRFGSTMELSETMFLTMTLRALGYEDSGEAADFTWDKPYALAKQVGLTDADSDNGTFTRGDAVEVFWNALSADMEDVDKTLSDQLIEDGVFTSAELAEARKIQKGESISTGGSSGSGGGSTGGNTGGTTTPDKAPEDYTWEEYQAMTPAEQEALYYRFGSVSDFYTWYNAAKEEYEESQNVIEIGPGESVDLGDLLGQ
ncbi:hypothetical protein [Flavonifractor sp. An4]|uniref:hypothetical protein n=1 Tax=Flavonifractor sp. An4 TaxID=1965634 RepID=UPI000B38DCA7|nr:hypothetical protein [Flavonifractor sp. An4]OUO14900.1 hypothetical protein B5F94_07840 [Flavonifractor sp. An4]